MIEGHKNRKLGNGMKPRGPGKLAPSPFKKPPVDEGQQESVIDPELMANAQAESGKVVEAEKLQNLESKTGENQPQNEAKNALEKALQDSTQSPVIQEPKEPDEEKPRTAVEAFESEDGGPTHQVAFLGEQPDGSYNMLLNIPEGWVEGVKQWAQENDVPPEQWVRDRFVEYMESWAIPAGKR